MNEKELGANKGKGKGGRRERGERGPRVGGKKAGGKDNQLKMTDDAFPTL